jgi:hypothetical protein
MSDDMDGTPGSTPIDAERVNAMLDEWECSRLHLHYWWGQAARDADAVAGLFTEDGTFGPAATGPDDISATLAGHFGAMTAIMDLYNSQPVMTSFTVDGDRAEADIRGMTFMRVRTEGGGHRLRVTDVGYHDEFVRTAEGWRISSLHAIEAGRDRFYDTHWEFEADLD